MNYSVSIIIPNYNGKNLLEKNLAKVIAACKHSQAEIIVVDDGSTDDSVVFLNQNFPQVTLLKRKKNYGFSATVNHGVAKASGDIVVLLNHDVYPKQDFLVALLPHFKNPKIFAAGCLQESIEDTKTVLRGRGIGTFRRGFLIHSRGEINKKDTLWVSGGAGAFRKSIWQELGGFDELFNPFYWEDIDLSYRALKAGYQLVFEPRSIVVHQSKKGAISSLYRPFTIKRIAYRNQFIFMWKNISDLFLIISHIFWLPYHFFSALGRFDFAFFGGFLSALYNFSRIVYQRRKSRKFWQKNDKLIGAAFGKEMRHRIK